MFDDKEFFDQLKEKYGKASRSSKGYVRIPCPTCTARDAKHMKRYVHPRMQVSKCFICGIAMQFEELLDMVFDSSCEIKVPEPKPHPASSSLPCSTIIPVSALPAAHPAIQFLVKDHLTDFNKYWTHYGIGYIPYEGGVNIWFDSGSKVLTSDSLVFPVQFNKEFVGWQCRFIPGTNHGDNMQKMRYFHVFPKGNYLFNFDAAKKHDTVVLVEGAKKALKADNAVASLGKGISDTQIQLLQEWKSIAIMLDGEDTTQQKAQELTNYIRTNARRCVCIDPRKYTFDSPDDMTVEEFAYIVDEAWKNYG